MLKYIKPFIFEPANNIVPGLEFLSNMHFIIQIYDASWYASLKETLCCITHNAWQKMRHHLQRKQTGEVQSCQKVIVLWLRFHYQYVILSLGFCNKFLFKINGSNISSRLQYIIRAFMRKGEAPISPANTLVGSYTSSELMYGCSIPYIIHNIALMEAALNTELLAPDSLLKCLYHRAEIQPAFIESVQ